MAAEALVKWTRSESVALARDDVQKDSAAAGMISNHSIHEDDLNNRKRRVLDAFPSD